MGQFVTRLPVGYMKRTFKNILLLALILLCGYPSLSSENQPIRKAPGFALNGMDGERYFLSKLLRNGPIVASFWATYCKPCKEEIEKIATLDLPIPVVYINIDSLSVRGEVNQKIKDWNIQGLNLLDYYQKTIEKYQPDLVIPATFLISKRGEILYSYSGNTEDRINLLKKYSDQLKESK